MVCTKYSKKNTLKSFEEPNRNRLHITEKSIKKQKAMAKALLKPHKKLSNISQKPFFPEFSQQRSRGATPARSTWVPLRVKFHFHETLKLARNLFSDIPLAYRYE